jgi:hypothetical protein
MKKYLRHVRCLAAVLLLSLAPLVSAQSVPGVDWKLAFVKWRATDIAALPFSRPVILSDGDKFQLFIMDVKTPAYCYVIYDSTDGKLSPLLQSTLRPGESILLPSESEAFQVSPPGGTEKIFVIVTAERQTRLERLFKSPDDAQVILDEVVRIRQSTSTLAEAPEKPAPMGGVTRGKDLAVQGSEYEGQLSYVKTIRIEH